MDGMAQQEQTPANSKTKKFLKGTMILTISSIVVKVIGALNWVILSRVMGGEGIGLYQMGFPIYLMAITVSSAGIPVAISIVTAEKVAKKDYGGAQHVFKVSLWMMLATGLLFTGALLGLAHVLVESGFIPDPRAYYSIIALAPAVFFVTFLSSFRGYFQGWQIMTPTACSEITEQLIRVVTMIAFSYLLLPYGLTYAAAGASMGAGAGAFCGLLVLLGFYRKLKHKFFPQGEENVPPQEPEPAGKIIKRLIMLALPVSMASLMLPIVSNLDMVIVPRRLMAGGWSMSEATTLFGYLTGMAVPLVNMSTILTAALSISLVPAISESRTLEDTEGIREKVAAAFSVAAVITIPCSIGLHVLGGRVAALIYNAPKAGPSIETMSWAIFLLGLHQVSTGILQGLGKTKIPVFNMIIAAASKVFLNWNLTPTMGIVGSSWATVADIGIAAILNLFFIKKYTGFSLELKQLVKTAVAAVAMGAAVKGFLALVPNWGAWSILGGMAVAIPVYALLLLLLKTMPEDELAQIPFVGRRMVLLGHKLKLL
jgi:stage V sporulation protein B